MEVCVSTPFIRATDSPRYRYPDVLKMETEVFHRFASEPSVQSALHDKFQDIAYGQMPQSSVVLNSLFQRFILPSGAARK